MKTTKQNVEAWQRRKTDWEDRYWNTQNHPHRGLLINILKEIYNDKPFKSLLEIGCACGPNLNLIRKNFPNVSLAGCDLSKDAIELGKKKLPEVDLRVGNVIDLPFKEKYDIVLTDACLMYIGPDRIKKAISEIKRVSSGTIVLVELNSKDYLKMLKLTLSTRNHVYDYKELLKERGFKSISTLKIKEEYWGGHPWGEFGYIITATI